MFQLFPQANSYATTLTDHLISSGGISAHPSPNDMSLRTRVSLGKGSYGVSLPVLNPIDLNSVVQVIYQASHVIIYVCHVIISQVIIEVHFII